jgi:hypothetical protein
LPEFLDLAQQRYPALAITAPVAISQRPPWRSITGPIKVRSAR